MSTIRTLEATCDGRAAQVEIVGSGPDLLKIGSAVPLAWSRPAAVALADHGFRTINFGYSASDGGVEHPEPRTCLQQVDDVIEVLAQVGTKTVVALGLSRGAITAYGLAARHPDATGDVTTPTLIVSGAKDRVVTPAHPARLHRAIPHAESYEFSDASHGFIMEKPHNFARVVAGFLN